MLFWETALAFPKTMPLLATAVHSGEHSPEMLWLWVPVNEAAGERESERLLGKREGGERKSCGQTKGLPWPKGREWGTGLSVCVWG